MDASLFNCLKDERSIFRNFSHSAMVGRFEAFHSPNLDEVPHWNLAYASNAEQEDPTPSEWMALKEHYLKTGVVGHFISAKKLDSVEESEYFVLNGEAKGDPRWPVFSLAHQPQNLEQFCKVVQVAFELSDESIRFFGEKMALLAKQTESRFYVVEHGARPIGCCSTFRAESGADFLFNMATLPEMRGQDVAKSILAYAASKSQRPLYTYSHADQMRQKILPQTGFESLGVLYVNCL